MHYVIMFTSAIVVGGFIGFIGMALLIKYGLL